MQQILIDIKFNQLFLQCAEIVKKGEVKITNDHSEELIKLPIINNNFLNIDLNLPPGIYHIELLEGNKAWKRNFKL